MEPKLSIKMATAKVGTVVARLIIGGALILLILGPAGYVTLKAFNNLFATGLATSVKEWDIFESLWLLLLYVPITLAGLVVLGFGSWMFITAVTEYPNARALSRQGREIFGAVVEVCEEKEVGNWAVLCGCLFLILTIFAGPTAGFNFPAISIYYMTFEYQVMAKAYRLRQKISGDLYHQVENGSTVSVRYLPGMPEVARLEKGDLR